MKATAALPPSRCTHPAHRYWVEGNLMGSPSLVTQRYWRVTRREVVGYTAWSKSGPPTYLCVWEGVFVSARACNKATLLSRATETLL